MNPAAPLYPPKATPTPEPQGIAVPKPQITALQNPPQAVAATPTVSAQAAPSSLPQPLVSAQPQSTPVASPSGQSTVVANTANTVASPATSAAPAAPRPVMSAKAAINAMYAAEKNNPSAKLIPSAREAVNAASRLAPKSFKSAANLHHGSLQKVQKVPSVPRSMESTRTSASALLRTVGSTSKDVPVVHTSLKLGASAKPKSEPVVLPAGSRMAEAARPVANLQNNSSARVITSGHSQLVASPRAGRRVRDPQMLSGGRRVLPSKTTLGLPAAGEVKAVSEARTLAPIALQSSVQHNPVPAAPRARMARPAQNIAVQTNQTRATRSMDMTPARKLVRPRRFRTAPKNYAETIPSVGSADNNYVMTEPPKLAVRRRSAAKPEDLGVVKNYHPSKLPEPIGDAAPIGRLAEQRVASGHGGPARPEPTIKAENTSNYSFSKHNDSKAKSASYASANKSPFLKSVNVEKRPLSDSSVPTPISLPRTAEAKPEKSSRKNSYQKKAEAKAELPSRPTVIVPSSRRSKAPLFFLILFTIILGAAVGAAVYLCFFQ